MKLLPRLAIGTVRPGKISPMRPVPAGIARPDYAATGIPRRRKEPRVKSPDVIERMRRTCKLAAEVLTATAEAGAPGITTDELAAEVLTATAEAVAPGITTDELDAVAHDVAVAAGAYPSPLNYNGFPKSI